jgi:hypothetical protein
MFKIFVIVLIRETLRIVKISIKNIISFVCHHCVLKIDLIMLIGEGRVAVKIYYQSQSCLMLLHILSICFCDQI